MDMSLEDLSKQLDGWTSDDSGQEELEACAIGGTDNQQPKRRADGYLSFRQKLLKFTETPSQESMLHPSMEVQSSRSESYTSGEEGQAAETPLGSLERTKVSLGHSDHTTAFNKYIRRHTSMEGNTSQGSSNTSGEEGHAAETPLVSLERTEVSLGYSEHTTYSKKFIRAEWGTQGTMHKIYNCIKSGSTPVDVHTLVSQGPVVCGQRRLIAARCFTSILNLKQHGLIRIQKNSETLEIKDIEFGDKIFCDE